ncbi:ornithine carbamoyltransferase [Cytobacillus spongiae]|uniref:ornithine carbamoyltransferase n=1 Tax=Cytobacillus spongiae TaxID=2901381 RepID=UPI001F15C0D9|nr:ornithine carbamoyltransferase [Cytobacillus spongiae]UII56994.1 ornithine carbamoyltransferase [Cytobacillus spongiae]
MISATQKKNSSLKGKSILTLSELSSEQIQFILDKAEQMKTNKEDGTHLLQGKIVGMIFDKPSTRTRVSFEAGTLQLGGHALYLNGQDLQLGRGETIADTAKVLSSYVDAIMIRTFSHQTVEELSLHASIPIINGLTDLYHPCQALADLLTIKEQKGQLKGVKLVYVGDGNNVANSLMLGAASMGITMEIVTPPGYEPQPSITKFAQLLAAKSGGRVMLHHDPFEAVKGADVIYTDVWTSMGQEQENEKRLMDFVNYQVNTTLLKEASQDYIFLHCLPAHRGEEVTSEVIDGEHSVVFQQAENRLHVQKALLAEILSS